MKSAEKSPTRKSRKPRGRGFSDLRKRKIEQQARQVAVCILEVLAGLKKPAESAESLGVSLPRYYALESRALEGLVEACRPRAKGPPRNPQREIQKLKAEIERLERESQRSQALLRIAQRAVGLSQSATKKPEPPARGKRRRKPTARALKAISALKENALAEDCALGENQVQVKSS